MNGTSFLLLLVFMVAGYVIHPMILPKLQAKGYVAETPEVEADEVKSDAITTKKGEINDPENNDQSESEMTPEQPVVIPEAAEEVDEPEFAPEPETAPEPEMEPEEVEEEPMPEVVPEIVENPEPKLSDDDQKLKDADENEVQVVQAMKDSVDAGGVSEFKTDQVVEWKLQGKKTVDGVEYDQGVVVYKAYTIFGAQELEAKALIKDGKVAKWLWGATDTEMK